MPPFYPRVHPLLPRSGGVFSGTAIGIKQVGMLGIELTRPIDNYRDGGTPKVIEDLTETKQTLAFEGESFHQHVTILSDCMQIVAKIVINTGSGKLATQVNVEPLHLFNALRSLRRSSRDCRLTGLELSTRGTVTGVAAAISLVESSENFAAVHVGC